MISRWFSGILFMSRPPFFHVFSPPRLSCRTRRQRCLRRVRSPWSQEIHGNPSGKIHGKSLGEDMPEKSLGNRWGNPLGNPWKFGWFWRGNLGNPWKSPKIMEFSHVWWQSLIPQGAGERNHQRFPPVPIVKRCRYIFLSRYVQIVCLA